MGDPAFDYRHLSLAERLQLVEDIWDSIADEVRDQPDALPLTAEQRDELGRRRAAYDRDPDAVVPWEDVRKGLLRRGG
jgi:putative addiction module component (TIGR02574 family)